MSNKETKVVGLEVKMPESLDHALKEFATPVAKQAGTTLSDLMYLVFGGISYRAEKRRIAYAQKLSAFKKGTEDKVNAIPPDKRVEPDTQTVLSALSDAQYCVESDNVRVMFENLIASSVNKDKYTNVHPSFSSIIRRMSSIDANNLLFLKNDDRHPIVQYCYKLVKGGEFPLYRNVLQPQLSPPEAIGQSNSFELLASLGLIAITYDSILADEDLYKPYSNCLLYTHACRAAQTGENATLTSGISIHYGYVYLTDLGKQFLDVCT